MSQRSRRPGRSERLFALLLGLFPREFRERFGQDMRELFSDQLHAARRRSGLAGVAGVWRRTLPSFARAVLLERRDAVRQRPFAPIATSPDTRSHGMFEILKDDVRFATRMLRRSPMFTIVSVVCISLGSGAVTTIFSGMNAVILRPLPGATDGTRLVAFERRSADGSEGASASYHLYELLKDRETTLDGLAAWSKVDLSIGVNGEGHAVYGNIVTGSYFRVLGVRPALGRFFAPDDDRTPERSPEIVVSYSFWNSRLRADRDAIGRTVTVNGRPYTLVGVTPSEFRGVFTPLKTDAWVPMMMQPHVRPGRDLADAPWLRLFGRLGPGADRIAAGRELTAITTEHARVAAEPQGFRSYNTIHVSGLTGLPDDARRAFLGFAGLLLGAAVLVLLIASVNVASMLTARGLSRRGELAVRSALGAGRLRLVRQLVTEVLLLFLLGGSGGVLIAVLGTGALEQLSVPGNAPISLELSPDLRVLAFALALSMFSGLVFGLPPAVQASRADLTSSLRASSLPGSAGRTFMGRTLIVGQLALSLVLLVSAGLFTRAVEQGRRVDPGFDLSGVIVASMNAESWGYDAERGRTFFRALRERLGNVPGFTAVSTTAIVPLSYSAYGDRIAVTGSAGCEAHVRVELTAVDPGYFDVVRIPVLRGRAIDRTDGERAPKVAVVNETLARRCWPDGSAVGRVFVYGNDPVTVIGVARDAKYSNLAERTPPFVYLAMDQSWRPDQTLVARTSLDSATAARAVQEAVVSIDPVLPRPAVTTLAYETGIVLLPQRVAAMVTGALGSVGLLLATVGLYGLIAYSVGRRAREIGVRVALGATRSNVLRLVLREGMRLTASGVAIGLVLAVFSSRLLTALLFNVSPMDLLTFGSMSVVFITVALVACYLPARRAAAADPSQVLRSE